ncbi:MAG: hypothetical protein SPI56_04000 [Alloprevotella sp.]|nr:hypothetical protein [Alloprevotella sp.]
MAQIVVFYHPGREYPVNGAPKFRETELMPWNARSFHRRKFLQAEGEFVASDGQGVESSLLRFWGEWEPTSEMCRLVGDSPRCLHIPFLKKDDQSKYTPEMGAAPHCGGDNAPKCNGKAKESKGLQNTDPFVFADHFFYGACQQNSKKGNPTNMQSLEKGSIILFGSRLKGKFVLDTVFVVEDEHEYSPGSMATDLKGFAPDVYPYIMQMGGHDKWTCYKGASFQEPFHQMYSFVPCRKCDGSEEQGFDRPVLDDADFKGCCNKQILSDGQQTQNRKVTPVSDAEAQKIWEAVRNSIRRQGYLEGFNFKYSIK